jgi:fatty-acid peroxygenase
VDHSLPLLVNGYAWLPDQRRRTTDDVVETRLMGRRAFGLAGPDAVRFFYDEEHVQRGTALPEPVVSTLFGHGAVHGLDGEHHRDRKSVFLSLMTPHDLATLVKETTAAWDAAVSSWTPGRRIVLFEEAARVLTTGVCRWAGVPVPDEEVPALAADLTAMVDGFATAGPRHWRARRARGRREAWLARLVEDVRSGDAAVPTGSALDVVAHHREPDGRLLAPRVAAVEVLNVVRPSVAVSWFVAFTAHALHRWPEHRQPLSEGEGPFAEAFVHEVRRFYPFAPFVGGKAVRDLSWKGHEIPAGSLVLLDIYGQNHDPRLWDDPHAFRPQRFLGREIGAFDLIPQGGGDPRTNHRCPGEPSTIALLEALAVRVARLDLPMPEQDLSISLRRIPALPRSRVVLTAR